LTVTQGVTLGWNIQRLRRTDVESPKPLRLTRINMKTQSNSFRCLALLMLVAACFLMAFASTTKTALKRIEMDQAPGLTDTVIVVGTLVPAKGALADTGHAIRAVTAAYFEEINSQGGIYGRKLELKIGETADTSAATAANLERLITNERVFALANVFSAGADQEIAALAEKNEVPLVGAITLTPQTAAPINRHVFYLLPGVAEQARALVSFTAQKFDKTSRFAIVYTEGNTISTLSANAVDAQSKSLLWPLPPRVVVKAELSDAMAMAVAELKATNTQAVYFFGTSDPSSFLTEAEKANFFPQVYLLGATGGRDIVNAPAGFGGKIFLAFPTVPSDVSADGMSKFSAFAQKHQLPKQHVAAQLSAYAAAQVFVEGLKLAGRDLSRGKLITSLEGLAEYQTGLMHSLTFGPNRRIGVLGAHIVGVDVQKKQFAPTGAWVGVNP
jgi:ABC-type branched-subunit amino acid transport system substrate-binding protein